MKRARILTTALLAGVMGLASPLLAGCYQGPAATTTVQATQPTGSGVDVQVGQIRVQNVLLVASIVEGGTASGELVLDESVMLIGRVFNDGDGEDVITNITIGGAPAALMVPPSGPNPLAIAPFSSVPLTYPAGGPQISAQTALAMSTYVPIQMFFERAGLVEFEALVIPRSGPYADVPQS